MKKLIFGFVALMIVLTAALTFSAFTSQTEKSTTQSTGWFLLDENSGDLIVPHQSVDQDEICPVSGEKYCAQEYNVDDGEPTSPTSTPVRMKQ